MTISAILIFKFDRDEIGAVDFILISFFCFDFEWEFPASSPKTTRESPERCSSEKPCFVEGRSPESEGASPGIQGVQPRAKINQIGPDRLGR